jgi:hypothetical protein
MKGWPEDTTNMSDGQEEEESESGQKSIFQIAYSANKPNPLQISVAQTMN